MFYVLLSSGLDPAGPQFEERDANDRLDAGHALFVDVIHTDTRLITTYGIFFLPDIIFSLGTNKRMGDSDFYPNDGYNQPGCELLSLGEYLHSYFFLLWMNIEYSCKPLKSSNSSNNRASCKQNKIQQVNEMKCR